MPQVGCTSPRKILFYKVDKYVGFLRANNNPQRIGDYYLWSLFHRNINTNALFTRVIFKVSSISPLILSFFALEITPDFAP